MIYPHGYDIRKRMIYAGAYAGNDYYITLRKQYIIEKRRPVTKNVTGRLFYSEGEEGSEGAVSSVGLARR